MLYPLMITALRSWLISGLKVNNGNWTEWSAVWSEIIRVILKSDKSVARVGFESTSMISDQIARREVQLPLYYSHFEDAEFCQYHYLFDLAAGLLKSGNKKAFNLILYLKQKWCNIERKWHDWKQKWCNLKHNWRDLEQTWLRTENCAWFVNKSHCWEPIRLQGSQVISKWI